jgi:hypothetical protein
MPQALLFVAQGVFGAGGSFALFTAAGGLTGLGIATSIGGSLLLSTAVAALNAPPSVDPDNIKLEIEQAIGDRTRHYGRVRVGGTRVFFRTSGGKFYRVLVHGEGPIDAVESYILDGVAVSINGDGWVTDAQYQTDGKILGLGGGSPLVRIFNRSGTAGQGYFSQIASVWPEYDATHRLAGLWATLTIAESVDAESYREVYPHNEPALQLVGRGCKVYDPRSGVTAWSDNAALIIADFIQHPDGLNLSGQIDLDLLAQAADDCDDQIALAAGGTESRYRIWGSYSLTEKPGEVLKRMMRACAGDVQLLPSGKIGIYVGRWRAPTVTLERSEIIGFDDWNGGPDQLDRYTELPFTYVDPDLAFQATTGDPWVDAVREAQNGQAAIGPEYDLSMCPSPTQGRRLAQIQIERDNPVMQLTMRFKPSARRAAFERYIQLNAPELPSTFWRVASRQLDLSTGGVTLQLRGYNPPEWSSAFEGEAQTLPEPDVSLPVPVPENPVAAGSGVRSAQNGYTAGIVVVWDPRPSPALSPAIKFARAGTGQFEEWPVSATTTRAQITGLVDGADYDLRLYFKTNDGLLSAAAVFDGVTATAASDAPAAPTNLVVTDRGGGEAQVSLRTSVSENLWKTQIIRGGSVVATLFNGPDLPASFIDTPGAGAVSYKARSVNVSGVLNAADAGPVSITVT